MGNPTEDIHHAAAEGYIGAADNYVRGRPDYPSEVADWLRDDLGLAADKTAVDLGAGTGKFTKRLAGTGARVIAIEPVPQMLARLAAAYPNVETHDGTAEAIPLPDASVDVVLCAQSFHWFATGKALAEIHRVLKLGGKLALIWNMRDARIDWIAQLDRIVNRMEGDTPRYYTGSWRDAFPFPGFGPLYERHFSHGHVGTPEDVILNRVRSTSFIAALPQADRDKIDAPVQALIAATPALKGQSTVTVPYETAAFHTIKTAGL